MPTEEKVATELITNAGHFLNYANIAWGSMGALVVYLGKKVIDLPKVYVSKVEYKEDMGKIDGHFAVLNKKADEQLVISTELKTIAKQKREWTRRED